jgi:hypothetical protein
MRAWLRLWGMCLRLILTSPLTGGVTAVVLLLAWKDALPAWAYSVAFASVSMVSLLWSTFFESGGALSEHIRLSRARYSILTAALGAVLTLAVAVWVLCVATGCRH